MDEGTLIVATASGPRRIALVPPGPLVIGRMPGHPICLDQDPAVSRWHAELRGERLRHGARWTLRDLGSRHGTRLNGVLLPKDRTTPLEAGDEIVVGSTILEFSPDPGTDSRTISAPLQEEEPTAAAATIADEVARTDLQRQRFGLLLEFGQQLHAATSRQELAERIVEVAVKGSGMPNAALLSGTPRPDGEWRVLSTCGTVVDGRGRLQASRSLIRGAADGQCMTFGGAAARGSESLMGLGVSEAICVPLLDGQTVTHLLYADRRGNSGGKAANDAVAFLSGIAKFGAMAFHGIGRTELEKRFRSIEADFLRAAAAQRMLLPDTLLQVERLSIEARSRSGESGVGGDFFVVRRHGLQLRIALGDVSGKGVGASVLMASLKGFVEGQFALQDSIEAVAIQIRDFVSRHADDFHRFVTAWIAEIDPAAGHIRYIDAGHGYALQTHHGRPGGDRGIEGLEGDATGSEAWLEANLIAFGADPAADYTVATTMLTPGGRLLIVSDGLVEQPAPVDQATSTLPEFGKSRLQRWLQHPEVRGLEDLFSAVHGFAKSDQLADDATAILIVADPSTA